MALTAVSRPPWAVSMMTMNILFVVLYLFEHLNSANARQLDIQQHQIRLIFTNDSQRIFTIAGGDNLITLLFKVLLQ